jgi:hypothetical protein
MTYLAAFIFTGVLFAGLAWFLCECLEASLDVEENQ